MEERRQYTFGLPKPKKGLLGLLIGVTAVWVFFAVGINWGRAGENVFQLLVGSAPAIFHGQVWRLFTNVFLHQPSGQGSVSHLLTTLMGLYFLGASLEERWGTRRFLMFTIGSAWFASALQVALSGIIPHIDQPMFFGGLGMVDAVAVAWAMSFKGQQVRLFFVLPVSGLGLVLFVLAMNVLYVLAAEGHREGFVTPFAGMLAGYLFSDGSPVRRWYLQLRFKKLQRESAALRGLRSEGIARLRVIEGGKRPDKSMLN